MERSVVILSLVLCLSVAVFADIGRPEKPTKSPSSLDTPMEIHLDRDAKEAKLIIPKSKLRQLRAEIDQMDDDNTAAVTSTGGMTRTQTIVSGAFLSLALVFGGIWFSRNGRSATRTGKTLVMLTVFAGAAFAATLVWANAGPPSQARSITGKMFSQAVHMYGVGWGTVKLETGDAERIDLIVPDPKDDSDKNSE